MEKYAIHSLCNISEYFYNSFPIIVVAVVVVEGERVVFDLNNPEADNP
jgi:hypothetical protein